MDERNPNKDPSLTMTDGVAGVAIAPNIVRARETAQCNILIMCSCRSQNVMFFRQQFTTTVTAARAREIFEAYGSQISGISRISGRFDNRDRMNASNASFVQQSIAWALNVIQLHRDREAKESKEGAS